MATDEPPDPEVEAHLKRLNELPDGCGCTEIWESLSNRRRTEKSTSTNRSLKPPNHPTAYVWVAFLGAFGLAGLIISLFLNIARPKIDSAIDPIVFSGFLLAVMLALVTLTRRRA